MKDMIDREIRVGDTIAYASSPYSTLRLTLGTVVNVSDDSVEVARLHSGGYGGVKDGMKQKWKWDPATKKGEYVLVKARNTRIGYSSRCLVVKEG